jgi:glyoxylase-like metal-dependent hydrolase (beta-lactamase superfamily II)
MSDMWEVYAIRLAERTLSSARVIAGQDGETTIAYLMYCLRNRDRVVLVDTGLSAADAAKRNLTGVVWPGDALTSIGVTPDSVEHIILTHLHGDHFSEWRAYPKAEFVVQAADVEFFTGPYTRFPTLSKSAGDLEALGTLTADGRVSAISGDNLLAPGLQLRLVGGHTPGSQGVIVQTELGKFVACGDAIPLLRCLDLGEPNPSSTSRIDSLVAFETLQTEVGGDRRRLLPGHDAAVLGLGEMVAPDVYRVA